MRRAARRWSWALLLALAAGSARAQEDDPLVRAARDQQALRDRQAQGIQRAEQKTYSPLSGDTMVSPGLQSPGSAETPAKPLPFPTAKPSRAGFLPWAIGAVALLMFLLLGWAVLRRNRE